MEFGFVYKLQQVPRLESPLSNITQKKHVLWLVQLLVFMVDKDQGCEQNKNMLTV